MNRNSSQQRVKICKLNESAINIKCVITKCLELSIFHYQKSKTKNKAQINWGNGETYIKLEFMHRINEQNWIRVYFSKKKIDWEKYSIFKLDSNRLIETFSLYKLK